MGLSKGLPYSVVQCESMLKAADEAAFALLEQTLKDDTRQGVQKALAAARRRLQRERELRDHTRQLYDFEAAQAAARNTRIVLGLDEVGRGALAGPLAVGGVVLEVGSEPIEGIDDSKQLTPATREALTPLIQERALGWTVVYKDPELIDRRGLSAVLKDAFREAIELLDASVPGIGLVLIDGLPLHLDRRELALVGGDRQCASIACASIVAKVSRDHRMEEFAQDYPGYDFEHSKGYGSARHREALQRLGLTPLHRRSFCGAFIQDSLFDLP